ncbi:MAG: helix-turn-helix domain-containing protein [Bacillota bacterium]
MEFLTTEEVAKIIKTTDYTVRKYINEGKLSALKIGKSWRISKDDLETFLNSCKTTPSMINKPPGEAPVKTPAVDEPALKTPAASKALPKRLAGSKPANQPKPDPEPLKESVQKQPKQMAEEREKERLPAVSHISEQELLKLVRQDEAEGDYIVRVYEQPKISRDKPKR